MDVESKVIEIVTREQHLPPGTVKRNSTFTELGIDSLDGMNILFEVEGAFDISARNRLADPKYGGNFGHR